MPSEAAQRLHPSSLLFGLGGAARRLLLPGVLVLFASRGSNPELWAMLLFLPAVVIVCARYFSYRYRLSGDELVIFEGILVRKERHIPYDRIQNIDLVQRPLHRLLRVAEVRVETAAGQEPEAALRVLSLAAVAQMRAGVFQRARADRPVAPADAPEARVLLELPFSEVALYGLLSNRGMVVVAAALGALWQFGVTERFADWFTPRRWLAWLVERQHPAQPQRLVLLVLASVVAAILLLRLFSIVLAVLKLHGFRLERRGEDLQATYGLLTRVSKTIPRHRIQLVTTRASALQRWAGRIAINVQTAGGHEDSSADRLTLAPLVAMERLPLLLAELLPEVDLADIDWRPLAPRAGRRILRRAIVRVLLIAGVTTALFGVAGLATLALLPLCWLHAWQSVRHTRWAVVAGAIFYRSGWWMRRMSVARFSKIQAIELSASPFDRRHAMATLHVDTAGGGAVRYPVAVRLLPAAVAAQLLERLSAETAQTAFRW